LVTQQTNEVGVSFPVPSMTIRTHSFSGPFSGWPNVLSKSANRKARNHKQVLDIMPLMQRWRGYVICLCDKCYLFMQQGERRRKALNGLL
jgi:hypothetical protein